MVKARSLLPFFAPCSRGQSPIRIAVGESAPYTDSSGNVWSADTDFNTGTTYTVTHAIAGTPEQTLYQHQRWTAGTLTYTIPVPAGAWTLSLLFSENYVTGPKERLFNVSVNGTRVLTQFDIFAAAGGEYIANVQTFSVTSTGTVTIAFAPGSIQNPTVNAIQLVPAGPPPPFVWVMPGLGTATFTMYVPPACGPNDGTCSIAIQVCDTSQTPPLCMTAPIGTLSLLKTISLPTPQTQTIPIVTVTNP